MKLLKLFQKEDTDVQIMDMLLEITYNNEILLNTLEDLTKQHNELKQRVEKMEKQLKGLKARENAYGPR
jgi:hypothetical protein